MNADDKLVDIAIAGPIDGQLMVGTELFNMGDVSIENRSVAHAGSIIAAYMVRATLLIDPELTVVRLPKGERLQRLQREWQAAVKRWQTDFDSATEKTLTGVTDPRTRAAVVSHAMALMHAK